MPGKVSSIIIEYKVGMKVDDYRSFGHKLLGIDTEPIDSAVIELIPPESMRGGKNGVLSILKDAFKRKAFLADITGIPTDRIRVYECEITTRELYVPTSPAPDEDFPADGP